YFTSMRIRFSVSHEIRDLVGVRLLDQQGDSYLFKYKYVYCYFVARYFRDYGNADPSVQPMVRDLVDRIYVEDFANILTFYLYLTPDNVVLQHLLESSKRILSEHRPADLEGDVAFVNRLFRELRPLELPATASADERREEHRRRLDEHEDDAPPAGSDGR